MNRQLKRSKSECDLPKYSSRRLSGTSESSNEAYVVDSASEWEDGKRDIFGTLDVKMDKLNDLFVEQCRLMSEIKEELRNSKTVAEKYERAQSKLITEVLKSALADSNNNASEAPLEQFNSRARSLLSAIESKHVFTLDRELRRMLVDLLQGEELRKEIVTATVDSLRDVISSDVSREISHVYTPVLRRANRRLAVQLTRTLDDGFAELEAHSTQLTNAVCRVTLSLRRALERHRSVLETDEYISYLRGVVEQILQQELKSWRETALESWRSSGSLDTAQWAERGASPPPLEYPHSPPQPADPESSVIDQLMKTAIINKQISDGDLNLAFSGALSAADLSLVMAACRAAPLDRVFAPCRLEQTVLLSLAQQLPTDMVHDTQLKCRYLEEVLINLDPAHPATREHLPLVVGEIRKHLICFLTKFPGHIANKRITLIIMAADNLLK